MKKSLIILLIVLLFSVVGNIFFLSQDVFEGTYVSIGNDFKISLKFYDNTFSRKICLKDGDLYCSTYGFYAEEERYYRDLYDINYYNVSGYKSHHVPDGNILENHKEIPGANRYTIFVIGEMESWYYICPSAIIIQIVWLVADTFLLAFIIRKIKTLKIRIKLVVEKTSKNE